MAERRNLTIDSLDQVMPEVDRLLEGHETVGNWTLGQICNHLTASLVGSIEGDPHPAPWLVRATLGRVIFRKIRRSRRIKAGFKTPERYEPKPGLDARAEAEALRAALQLFAGHADALATHPFFGAIGRDGWTELHCIHCAHHLSFVLPKTT
jgi:hypothetical protein